MTTFSILLDSLRQKTIKLSPYSETPDGKLEEAKSMLLACYASLEMTERVLRQIAWDQNTSTRCRMDANAVVQDVMRLLKGEVKR